jgi:hypothetical protein
MLNFVEQTGSGAVMSVWSFSLLYQKFRFINYLLVITFFFCTLLHRFLYFLTTHTVKANPMLLV